MCWWLAEQDFFEEIKPYFLKLLQSARPWGQIGKGGWTIEVWDFETAVLRVWPFGCSPPLRCYPARRKLARKKLSVLSICSLCTRFHWPLSPQDNVEACRWWILSISVCVQVWGESSWSLMPRALMDHMRSKTALGCLSPVPPSHPAKRPKWYCTLNKDMNVLSCSGGGKEIWMGMSIVPRREKGFIKVKPELTSSSKAIHFHRSKILYWRKRLPLSLGFESIFLYSLLIKCEASVIWESKEHFNHKGSFSTVPLVRNLLRKILAKFCHCQRPKPAWFPKLQSVLCLLITLL